MKTFESIRELVEYFGVNYSAWTKKYHSNDEYGITDGGADNINIVTVWDKKNSKTFKYAWKLGIYNEYGQKLSSEVWENNTLNLLKEEILVHTTGIGYHELQNDIWV